MTAKTRTRSAVALAVTAAVCSSLTACGSTGAASDDGGDIVIGAAWPLSGSFGHNGQAVLAGAEAAVADINAGGGIASMDGRKLTLESVDVGGTPASASSAMNRLLRNDQIVAVAGSWLSSLTLAATEVTERQGVPMISESFADEVTERKGFKHVFSYAPPSSKIADLLLDSALPSLEAARKKINRVAVVGDNSAAATPLQDGLRSALDERGIAVAATEQWAVPLQDPSGIAQKIADADVDAIFMIAFGFNDVSALVSQLQARGVDAPIIQNGGQAIVPQWRDIANRALGLASFVYTNPIAKSPELAESIAQDTDAPYAWQDQLGGYFAVQVIAEALEESGEASREAVNDALHALELDSGPAADLMPVESISFDESGRIAPYFGVLAQWQRVDGKLVPCTVFPEEYATCDANWE